MKIPVILISILVVIVLTGSSVEARLLPRFKNAKPAGRTAVASSSLVVSPRLRSDRQGLTITFNNLQKVKSVFYTLMYQTNGKDEGVSGTLTAASGNSATRELLFGTCSSGVCRYHRNISQMKLEVVSELPSGKRTLKRFRIRI